MRPMMQLPVRTVMPIEAIANKRLRKAWRKELSALRLLRIKI